MAVGVWLPRYLGDTVLSFPFLSACKHTYPDKALIVFCNGAYQPLVSRHPAVDRAITIEHRGQNPLKLLAHIQAERLDTVYLAKRSLSVAVYALCAGIPNRIGFDTDARGWALTRRIPYTRETRHESVQYLRLIQDDPITLPELNSRSWLAQPNLVPSLPPGVVMHATSSDPRRQWPLEKFQAVLQRILDDTALPVHCFGSAGEKPVYEALFAPFQAHFTDRLFNHCGQFDVAQTAAALSLMRLLIGNDSGLAHLASAVELPVVVLFGMNSPKQWRPLGQQVTLLDAGAKLIATGKNRQQVDLRTCDITPEEVWDACAPYWTH